MNLTDKISLAQISNDNKDLLLKYLKFNLLKNISEVRLIKKIGILISISKMFDMDFKKIKQKDFEDWYLNLKTWPRSTHTKRDYVIILKQFWKWYKGNNKVYPDEIEWMNIKPPQERIEPSNLIKDEEFERIINACSSIRDIALFNLMREGGPRSAEVLSMKIKDFELRENDASVRFPTGKTGPRTIIIIKSIPFILDWIKVHPDRNNLEAYLWTKLNSPKQLGKFAIRMNLLRICKRAKLQKRIYAHLFRHTCATELAEAGWSEYEMCLYLGWRIGSKMPSVYIHSSGRSLKNKVKERYGLKTDKSHSEAKLKECPSCRTLNDCKAKFCSQCHRTLDLKAAQQKLDQDMKMTKAGIIVSTLEKYNPELIEKLFVLLEKEKNKKK